MKELSKDNPVQIRRSGYAGSGFVFYFVRCLDRKALAQFAAGLPHGPVYTAEDAPYGLTHTFTADTLEGIIPEAHDGRLWSAYIMVAECFDKEDCLTPVQRRRHWYHEIGHTVDFFCQALTNKFAHGPYGSCTPRAELNEYFTEAPALCNEFLCECLDIMLRGSVEDACSGLPQIMPWIPAPVEVEVEFDEMTGGAL